MSSRALTFLADVVERHGRALDDGLIEVPFTQAELARRQGCSAGTVAYYLREAGDLVVDRRRRGLVIDLVALELARPRPRTSARHLRLAANPHPPRPPEPPPTKRAPPGLSGEEVLDAVATLADCLTQLSARLVELAERLLGTDVTPAKPASSSPAIPRGSASNPADPATVASGFSLDSYFRKEESLPSSQDSERTRETRESAATPVPGDHLADADAEAPLHHAQVDELVAPLRALARRSGRPDTLDDNGRAVLARLSEAQLRQGVLRAQQEAAADHSIRKPLGLLVHKALSCQSEFFAGPPAPPPPPALVVEESMPASLDEEAVAAVATMEADGERCQELALVDEEVRSWLALHGGNDSMQRVLLRRSHRALRQEAWRRLHQATEDQAAVAG